MAIDYQSSFNSGELSGRMNGRSSLEVYGNGCSRLENFYVLPQGGIERRTGTEFIAQTNSGVGDKRAKMIPFIFSSTQSYSVEFGDGYITVWNGDVPILVTDSSPYADADLDDIDVRQKFDIMYIEHPRIPLYELRRETLDPTFSIQQLEFDYPPLLDQNTTDIQMSPSDVDGTITLTSSQDFFSEDHVGANMAFEAPRTIANSTISGTLPIGVAPNLELISDPLYVSNSEWDFSSSGTWRGKVTIQRSLDNQITWEDFVIIGDTTDATALNFTYPSAGQEGVGVWVRVQYLKDDGTFTYQLKTLDPWKTLVKITGYIDAQNVTAEVLDQFQDTQVDYTDWLTGQAYVKGDKKSVGSGITYTATNINLTAILGGGDLDEIVGADYGGGYFWVVTSGTSNKKVWKLNGSMTAIEAGFPVDISGTFGHIVSDITFYSNKLYISGGTTSTINKVMRFDLDAIYEAEEYNYGNFVIDGLGYLNNSFYLGINSLASSIQKFSTGFNNSGILAVTGTNKQRDVTGIDSLIYAANASDNSIDIYNESLVPIGGADITNQTTVPNGIAWDGSNLWIFSEVGVAYQYELVSATSYYECTLGHDSGVFSADYSSGYWADRTPVMTTWSEGAFSDYQGHPRSLTFHEDRMWLVGSDGEPSTIYASVSGDYYNFATNDLASGSIRRIPDNPEVAQWLIGRQRMILGTEGGAIVVRSVDENSLIDASNIVTSSQAVFGASSIPAIEAGDVVVYSERSNKKLREIIYNRDEENIRSADMNILNNEILEGGVKELFLQQQPDQIIWAIDGNGDAACLTYERLQEVVGWSRYITNGTIESACRLPSANSEDEIWMCVNRNGVYTIERSKPRSDADWYVDSGVEAITGLDHLEGLEVRCLVDGANDGVYTVSSGEITPTTSGSAYLVGLDYDSIMRTMPIEPNLMNKLPNSRIKGAVKCTAEFYPTTGGSIREKNKTGEIFDEVEFSGEKKFNIASDWTREKIIEIKQHLPYPMTILSLAVWTEAKGG